MKIPVFVLISYFFLQKYKIYQKKNFKSYEV